MHCYPQQQQFKITYDYHIGAKLNGVKLMDTYIKTYLTGNGENSVYEEDFIASQSASTDNNTMNVKTNNNPQFYKDSNQKNITYLDDISFKKFIVNDSIGTLDWQIKPETKTILGYNCQKATLFFRGRNFDVFFTPEIPFSDGPWKLSGLPGMILEVKTDNELGQYDFVAIKVELENSPAKITNPFENKEMITYDVFVKKYQKKYEERQAELVLSGNSGGMPKGYLELYVQK